MEKSVLEELVNTGVQISNEWATYLLQIWLFRVVAFQAGENKI